MMWTLNLLITTGLLYNAISARDIRVVDLTHEHNADTIYWPGNPEYNFTILFRGPSNKGYWYESNTIQTAEHGGTHIDSPAHFAEAKHRTEQIPMENLVGPGVIIDVKSKVLTDPDYRVTVEDLIVWETVHGRIPDGAVVIMNSGWTYKYPNKTLTFGTQVVDDPSTFHFPGWHEDAADWLVKNRQVHVVGVDTPSMDYGRSTTYRVHIILGKANIPAVENIANLDAIPGSGAMVYVAPMKLYDGSGAPARVFATVTDGSSNSATTFSTNALLSVLIIINYACIL